jgi:hypothetical protein
MGEIINLRRMRKRRAVEAAQETAAANRLLHGRRKDERRLSEAEKAAAERFLEARRLTPREDGETH